jgi:hypothetical protein
MIDPTTKSGIHVTIDTAARFEIQDTITIAREFGTRGTIITVTDFENHIMIMMAVNFGIHGMIMKAKKSVSHETITIIAKLGIHGTIVAATDTGTHEVIEKAAKFEMHATLKIIMRINGAVRLAMITITASFPPRLARCASMVVSPNQPPPRKMASFVIVRGRRSIESCKILLLAHPRGQIYSDVRPVRSLTSAKSSRTVPGTTTQRTTFIRL